VAVGLTQIGEFSYVLIRVARDSQLVGESVYHAVLTASVISIVLNGLLIKAAPRLLPPLEAKR
jgi:predicted Kef-type K+ transport protein